MIENWTMRKRPARLERRIDFDNYDLLRDFLDLAADVSEREDFYPDMTFSRTHVNMTIHIEDEASGLTDAQQRFAENVNLFAPINNISQLVEAEYSVEGKK